MKRKKMAGFSGASWVLPPPISHDKAQEEFGREIPDLAWLEICEAFAKHGVRLDDLEATRLNNNRNDGRGWKSRKDATERRLSKAITLLDDINRDFLWEAEENISLKKSGGVDSYGLVERLNNAIDTILFLSSMLRDAEPIEREIPSKFESQRMLAKDVFAALEPYGAKLSNGWKLAEMDPSYSDLTSFERLSESLEILEAVGPLATSKWLRKAVAPKR
jgi:hypothetical protein